MGKKIVVIEDQEDLGEALLEALKDKGYEAKLASTGEAGVELIEKEYPDLLLLDFLLPGIDGLEVLERLKAKRDETPLPVVMLSNLDNPEDLSRAREYGIEEYLVKSDWRLEDVMEVVRKAL